MSTSLKATGERLIPEKYNQTFTDRIIFLTHTATYEFAKKYAKGRVLDFGCGAGYGTAMIGQICDEIVGVDVDSATISAAQKQYGSNKTTFKHILPSEKAPLPFTDASFDTVLTFQVIEHVLQPLEYLRQAFRVLKPLA